jgi:Trypsin-co-occurring domain 1
MEPPPQPRQTKIMVQVVPSPARAGQLAPSKTWESLEKRIDELGESIGEIADRLRSRLDASLARSRQEPDWDLGEVEVKFSLDLEAEAGVVVMRAKTTAGFEVSLRWKRE